MKIEATKEPFDLDRKSTLKKPQIKFEWVDVRRKDVSLPADVPDPTTHINCLSSQAWYSQNMAKGAISMRDNTEKLKNNRLGGCKEYTDPTH